jgi:hypothetical protein
MPSPAQVQALIEKACRLMRREASGEQTVSSGDFYACADALEAVLRESPPPAELKGWPCSLHPSHSVPCSVCAGPPPHPQTARTIPILKALKLTIEQLESLRPDDPESPFIGEVVIARNDVLQAIDVFAASAVTESVGDSTPAPSPAEVLVYFLASLGEVGTVGDHVSAARVSRLRSRTNTRSMKGRP